MQHNSQFTINFEVLKIKSEIIKKQLNQLGADNIPFFFVIDFSINKYYLSPLAALEPDIFFMFDGKSNFTDLSHFAPASRMILKKNRLV